MLRSLAMSNAERRASGEEIARAAAQHHARLHHAAARILGCGDAARDAVQEALIALWLNPPERAPEHAWLVRTVVHRSLHQRRTSNRRRRWEHEAANEHTDDCPLCDPENELQTREACRLADEALNSLPESYRIAWLRREIDGWDYERIAQHMAVPVGTVRSRLNRAKAALRAYMVTRSAHEQSGLPFTSELLV
jgi:RNA polymerase sigma-70 factor (ECF subfamily)